MAQSQAFSGKAGRSQPRQKSKSLAGPELALTADAAKDAVVISKEDLQMIQNLHHPQQTQSEMRRTASAELGRDRKQRMLDIDAKYKRDPANLEAQQAAKTQHDYLLARAKQAMDEEHDDVKHMNQMVLYAKCVTIRDQQIHEKKRRMDEEEEEERKQDLAMEVERIKWLKENEERERARAIEQRAGARVVITQIAERQAERIREQEAKEQEAQAMLHRIKELEQREEEERRQKVVAGRRLLEQVMKDNNAQARAKLRKKQEEIEEDLRIAEYIRQKELRDQEIEAEQLRIKAEKEREIARLRAQQEKAQDRQAAIDELRAKRYQEAKDRAWRNQQMAEAEKRETLKREMQLAREQQRSEKTHRIAEQALQEREEYLRILEHQKQLAEQEGSKADSGKDDRRKHREALLAQIAERQAAKKQARETFLREGKQYTGHTDSDRARLERIKAQKIEELARVGVPDKYQAELRRKKVLVASIHH